MGHVCLMKKYPGMKIKTFQRRDDVERLMLAGLPIEQIVTYGNDKGWDNHAVRRDFNAITDEWSKQSEEALQHARGQAVQRIRGDLARMRLEAEKQPKGRKGPQWAELQAATFKDIAAHERLLAQIEGTLRPVEIKLTINDSSRRALIDVINAMAPAEMDQLIREQKDLELRASQKRN